MTIYPENDNLITLSNLKDQASNVIVNTAIVTYELLKSDGTSVDAGSMDYVSGSEGRYETILEDGLPIVVGVTYKLVIIATAGGDTVGKWTKNLTARNRTL